MSARAPSAKAEPLGLAARGALGVLLESIRLEGSGIHLVLTDRHGACLRHVLGRSGLPCTALFSGDDTRLADAAFAPPESGQILVDVLDPRVEGQAKAVLALNIEREG